MGARASAAPGFTRYVSSDPWSPPIEGTLLARYSALAVFAFALPGGLALPGTAFAHTPQDSLRAELEAARAEGAPVEIAYAHNDLGLEALRVGDYETAVFHFDSARVLRSALPDTLAWARSANNLGVAHHQWGRLEPALLAWEEAEALWRATGNDDGVATVLTNVGRLYTAWRAGGRALEAFEEAVVHARRDGDPALIGYALESLGTSLLDAGDLASARSAFEEAGELLDSIETERASPPRGVRGLVALGLARLRLAEGDAAGAVPMLEALFDGPPEEAFTDRQGGALIVLGDALSGAGETARAEVIYQRALDLARGAGQSSRQIRALEGLVALNSARGDTEAAARDLAEIAGLRAELLDLSIEERLVALEARGAADRANRENVALRRDLDVDRAALARQRWVGLLGLGVLLSLGGFAVFVVRQRVALEAANVDLSEAMAQVRTLEQMIPICASCKRIRSDAGDWGVGRVVPDRTRRRELLARDLRRVRAEAVRRGDLGGRYTMRMWMTTNRVRHCAGGAPRGRLGSGGGDEGPADVPLAGGRTRTYSK